MVDTLVRWACVNRIIDLAGQQAELRDDAVSLTAWWPGDQVGPDRIYLGDLDSAEPINVPVTRGSAARLVYDDTFVMRWGVESVANGRDLDETADRCESLLNAFITAIAENAQLDSLPGVISARITDLKGPLIPELPGVGHIAVAQLEVTVHSRID